jgi:hypothetical protein
MSSTNLLRSRDTLTTWGLAAAGIIAATCLGIAAASDTLSAVNPFYFSHPQDRGTGPISDTSAGTDSIPSTQFAIDYSAPAPLYADARFPPQPSSEPAPSLLSGDVDRQAASAPVERETVDEEQSVASEQVPASAVADTAPPADEAQSLERDAVGEQDAADISSDPSDSATVAFSAATDR